MVKKDQLIPGSWGEEPDEAYQIVWWDRSVDWRQQIERREDKIKMGKEEEKDSRKERRIQRRRKSTASRHQNQIMEHKR